MACGRRSYCHSGGYQRRTCRLTVGLANASAQVTNDHARMYFGPLCFCCFVQSSGLICAAHLDSNLGSAGASYSMLRIAAYVKPKLSRGEIGSRAFQLAQFELTLRSCFFANAAFIDSNSNADGSATLGLQGPAAVFQSVAFTKAFC